MGVDVCVFNGIIVQYCIGKCAFFGYKMYTNTLSVLTKRHQMFTLTGERRRRKKKRRREENLTEKDNYVLVNEVKTKIPST